MYKYFCCIWLVSLFIACNHNESAKTRFPKIIGQTMGTHYSLIYDQTEYQIKKSQIDSLLRKLNAGLSTYLPSSVISQFNQLGSIELDTSRIEDLHFFKVLLNAKHIHNISDGKFDPTVMPLVNYYGFGYKHKIPLKLINSDTISALKKLVSLDLIKIYNIQANIFISSAKKGLQLDFSANAKGYAVDYISKYLNDKGVKNFLFDIGGESKCQGLNPSGLKWTLGINKPEENAPLNTISLLIQMSNKSIASSGNYRNFYKIDNDTISHTIDPNNGLPARAIAACTVITNDCMTADALATSCMVMGLPDAKELIEQMKDTEACFFIYENSTLSYVFSSGFDKYLKD